LLKNNSLLHSHPVCV